jgi:SPP1 gp7 family putative phage head morphogenesis protein
MPKLFTKKKQKWVSQRKPNVIQGTPLNNPSILEAKFAAKLENEVAKMADAVTARIIRMFETPDADQYFAQDASIASQAKIITNKLMNKFNSIFADFAERATESHLNAVNKASSASVHNSLKALSGGLSLPTSAFSEEMKEVLKASTIESVSLIKSISTQYLSGVRQAVVRSIASGRGLADLVPYLERSKEITKRRASMIAHDQTLKSYSNLNRARMEKCGITHYRWLHTGGSAHPRKLHIELSGKIFRWDDPPIADENTKERANPAGLINCRCRAQPVIDLES